MAHGAEDATSALIDECEGLFKIDQRKTSNECVQRESMCQRPAQVRIDTGWEDLGYLGALGGPTWPRGSESVRENL